MESYKKLSRNFEAVFGIKKSPDGVRAGEEGGDCQDCEISSSVILSNFWIRRAVVIIPSIRASMITRITTHAPPLLSSSSSDELRASPK
jgi:hypothetical protein